MALRKKKVFLMLPVAAFVLFAAFFDVRYRFIRIEKLEAVNPEVYAILEEAVDSLKILSSHFRNTSLFVDTPGNSLCLSIDLPSAFILSSETDGYVRVNGTNVFLSRDTLGNDIPNAFSGTGRKSTFIVLSPEGYDHDSNRYWLKDDTFAETLGKRYYYKFIDGHWCESTWKETYGEVSQKIFEQWRREHPDTLEFKAPIPPVFAERYDSLTENNFHAFLKDWEQWSVQTRTLSTDSLLNAILTNVLEEYGAETEKDTCVFLSLCDVIEIRKYQGNATDYPANQEGGWREDQDAEWDYMMNASERYCYVPSIHSDKTVLYISPEIQRLLSLYIGGVCESEEDDPTNSQKWTGINEDRLSDLRKLIPVARGHWGGYWHFKTMPIISSIYLFDDGYVVDMRTSWCTGETVFYPYDPSREKVVNSRWIE